MKRIYQCDKCGKIVTIDKPLSEMYIPECSCNPEIPMIKIQVSKR